MSDRVVAVVGATGVVGRTMVSILGERDFPVGRLRLLASARSAGAVVETPWGEAVVEDLSTADPEGIDVALFSAGAGRSREHASRFVDSEVVVVDNSSAFRMDPDVPLVVAGVNDEAVAGHRGLIANPNCTTMALMVAAGPLHRAAGLVSVVAATYQSVSGSGRQGVEELMRQSHQLIDSPEALQSGGWEDPGSEVYRRPIAFNVVPFAVAESDAGYTDEEWKLVRESRKILDLPGLAVEPTCVRVPVVAGHGVAATLRFHRAMSREEAVEVLSDAPGVAVWDTDIPTPLDAAGSDDVLVGRIRPTLGEPGGINLWVVGDNLRKGAALNAIQIAELLVT